MFPPTATVVVPYRLDRSDHLVDYDKLGPFIKKPVIDNTFKHVSVLGAFAKWRKVIHSFVMFVRPSAWSNSAPTGQIFK
jgi:hypothetical protein